MPSTTSRRVFASWVGARARLAGLATCCLVDLGLAVWLRTEAGGPALGLLALARLGLGGCGGLAAFLLGSRTERRRRRRSGGSDLGGPLLHGGHTRRRSGEEELRSADFALFVDQAQDQVASLREFHLSQRRDHVVRDRILDALFALATVSAAATGVTAVTRAYPPEPFLRGAQVAAFSLLVFLIHAELALLRDAVWCTTDAEAVLIPEVHQHPIYFIPVMKVCRRCQFCSKVVKDAFRCPMCWNYCCVGCLQSRMVRARASQARGAPAVVGEGQIMGDAGPKPMPSSFDVWRLLRQTVRLTRSFAHVVALTLAAVALTQVFAVLRPHFQGRILDDIALGHREPFARDVGAFVGVSLAAGLFSGGQNLGVELIARKLSFTVKESLFTRFMEQDVAFFDAMSTGVLTSRLNNDVNMMLWPARGIMRTLLGNSLLLLGGLGMCFLTSWQLTVLTFSTISPVADLTRRYASWAAGLNNQIAAANAEANTVAQEALSNARSVKAHGMEEREVTRYAEHLGEGLRAGVRDAMGSAATIALTNYIEYLTGILVLWYGGSLVFDSRGSALSVGKLVTFMLYWNQMQSGWKELTNMLNDFTRAAGASHNVLAMLDVHPDMAQDSGLEPPCEDEFEWSVGFRSVSFFYWMRAGQPVLHGVSLDIPAGSSCAFVGRSGGGKSTLVHLLMRFYDPRPPPEGGDAGQVLIGDVDLRLLPQAWYRKRVGLVGQDTPLFNLTILENIAYGLDTGSYAEADVRAACSAACALEFIDKLEEGLQTRVGERGLRLSGGQRQRIALARCFLRRPRLLLLDEATSALDAASEAAVQSGIDALIAQAARRVTVVLVAHRLSTVVGVDKIVVIHEGRIAEEGPHEDLLARRGVYAKLVEAQLRRAANDLEEAAIDPKKST